MDKSRIAKIGRVIGNVAVYVVLAVCVCTVLLTLLAKREDGAAEVFGYQMRLVTSSSMEASEHTDVSGYEIKSIPIRSLVFIQTVPEDETEADEWYGNLKKGDVLTFRYSYNYPRYVIITHRIESIQENDNGGYTIVLSGDNKSSEDGALTQTIDTSRYDTLCGVIGKVTGQAPFVGRAMSFLKENPIAMALIVILPCAVIILFEALKIAKVVSESKRARELAGHEKEKQLQENEIAELRRRLAELEQKDGEDQP